MTLLLCLLSSTKNIPIKPSIIFCMNRGLSFSSWLSTMYAKVIEVALNKLVFKYKWLHSFASVFSEHFKHLSLHVIALGPGWFS